MRATPGITLPNLSRDPLGTEAELTPGPDDYNPYDDPRVPEGKEFDPVALPDEVVPLTEELDESEAFDAPDDADEWPPGGLHSVL